MALVTGLTAGLATARRRLRSLDTGRIGGRRLRRVRRVLRQLRLQLAHLAQRPHDHRFQRRDLARLRDDLFALLHQLPPLLDELLVSVVDGFDLTIEIRSATRSTDFRRDAVNAYTRHAVVNVAERVDEPTTAVLRGAARRPRWIG